MKVDKPNSDIEWMNPTIDYETDEPTVTQSTTPLRADDSGSDSGSEKKVLYSRSAASDTSGYPKLPSNMEYGELAINYGDGLEVIAIKNSKDAIIAFIPLKAFLEASTVTNPDYLIGVDNDELCLSRYS